MLSDQGQMINQKGDKSKNNKHFESSQKLLKSSSKWKI